MKDQVVSAPTGTRQTPIGLGTWRCVFICLCLCSPSAFVGREDFVFGPLSQRADRLICDARHGERNFAKMTERSRCGGGVGCVDVLSGSGRI